MKIILKSKTIVALFIAVCMSWASCTDEPEDRKLYCQIEDGQTEFEFESQGTVYDKNGNRYSLYEAYAKGTAPRLSFYSNYDEWRLEPAFKGDEEWVYLWPNSGTGSGRFFLTVDENPEASARRTEINVISHNRVVHSFSITQKGANPVLELDMDGMTRQTVIAEGGVVNLKVRTNTLWKPSVSQSAGSWISFRDQSDSEVTIVAEANPEDDPRSADVVLTMSGSGNESVRQVFTVIQQGGRSAFSRARKVTVAELLRLTGERAGTIDENLYVEGWVTSDRTKNNVEQHFISYDKADGRYVASVKNRQMWLQDDSGKGICVEFTKDEYNSYALDDLLTLHVADQSFAVDEQTGTLKLAGIMPSAVKNAVRGGQATPVSVSSLADMSAYENTLVTLRNVSFALSYGTLFNTDERFCYYTDENLAQLDASTRQYPHLLFDGEGNAIRLYTACTFPDRHARMIPSGSGDLTGIVTKRITKGREEYIIRLRSDADNAVSDHAATSLAKPIVRFGPFETNVSSDNVRADYGSGTIKTSMFSQISATSSSTSMYWVWGAIHRQTRDASSDGFPAPDINNQYAAINAQNWYDGTGTSLTDALGEAWIVSADTRAAGSGTLWLIFATATYRNGPRDFVIEWNDSESAPLAEWKRIEEYESCSWNANYQAKVYMVRLPDELKDKASVVIRHRVTSRATTKTENGQITSTGTNRMCYWSIVELKK